MNLTVAQLLVMDVSKGDGFDVLCPFLGRTDGPCSFVSTGAAVTPFPRDNTREERSVRVSQRGYSQPAVDAPRGSRYAYVSMLANPSEGSRRDYLMSMLVAAASIRKTGSTYDIVVLLYGTIEDSDAALIESEGIKVCLLRLCTCHR
jgi:hypothetical protein